MSEVATLPLLAYGWKIMYAQVEWLTFYKNTNPDLPGMLHYTSKTPACLEAFDLGGGLDSAFTLFAFISFVL